jgi:hypothetical protein
VIYAKDARKTLRGFHQIDNLFQFSLFASFTPWREAFWMFAAAKRLLSVHELG